MTSINDKDIEKLGRIIFNLTDIEEEVRKEGIDEIADKMHGQLSALLDIFDELL